MQPIWYYYSFNSGWLASSRTLRGLLYVGVFGIKLFEKTLIWGQHVLSLSFSLSFSPSLSLLPPPPLHSSCFTVCHCTASVVCGFKPLSPAPPVSSGVHPLHTHSHKPTLCYTHTHTSCRVAGGRPVMKYCHARPNRRLAVKDQWTEMPHKIFAAKYTPQPLLGLSVLLTPPIFLSVYTHTHRPAMFGYVFMYVCIYLFLYLFLDLGKGY